MRPEFKFEAEIDRQWWSGPTTLVNGRDREVAGRKLEVHGGTWLDKTYVKGSYITAGEVRKGETGIETVIGDIIPTSFVDSRELVNGESVVKPEYRDAFASYREAYANYLVDLVLYNADAIIAAQSPPLELILGQEALVTQDKPPEERQAA